MAKKKKKITKKPDRVQRKLNKLQGLKAVQKKKGK